MKPKSLLPIIAFALHLIPDCVGTPEGIKPVNNFDLPRYLGNWILKGTPCQKPFA